jgi:hypothetical protein
MSLNSLASQQLFDQIATIEQRVSTLQAMVQGAPIDTARIGTAIITTAKIEDGAITTGKIATGAVTNAKVDSLSAVKVTAGTISADRIGADTITADKLDVDELSAISANFGTLTAGSITGITITGDRIRTSSGDDMVSLSDENFFLFDGGDITFTLQPNVGGYIGGAGLGFFELGSSSESGSFRGVAGINSGETDFIVGTANAPLVLIQALNSGGIVVETSSGDIHFNCTTFQINGSTKTAIVPTNSGYMALYSVEAPEVWFFDIVKDFKSIDPMFWEVTEGEVKTVNNGESMLVFRRRKGFAKLRFTKKTRQQFLANEKLWQN